MAYEHLSWASKTDVGRKRKNNEDSHVCLPQSGIFCVADGMGGMAAGDVASGIVVGTIREHFEAEARPMSSSEKSRKAIAALSIANDRIHEAARARGLQQVGSTVVVAAFDGRNPAKLTIVHAGDSRCYRFRDGKLLQLTTDHSVAEAVGIDEKKLSAMFRGVVTRAIGTVDVIEPERTNMQAQAGDVYLICSDGLTRMVADAEITKILAERADGPLQQRADALVNAANEAGGDDNVTALLIQVSAWKPEAVLETAADEDPGSSTSVGEPEDKDTQDEMTPVSQISLPLPDLQKEATGNGATASQMTMTKPPRAETEEAAEQRSKLRVMLAGIFIIAALILIAYYVVNERKKDAQYRLDVTNMNTGAQGSATSAAPAVATDTGVARKVVFELKDEGKRFMIHVRGGKPVEPLFDGAWDVVKAHKAEFDEWRKENPSEATKHADAWLALWDEMCEPATAAQRLAAFHARTRMLQRLGAVLPQITLAVQNPPGDEPREICHAYAVMQSTVAAGLDSFSSQNKEATAFSSTEGNRVLQEIARLSGRKLSPEASRAIGRLYSESRSVRQSPLQQRAEIKSPAWKPEDAETFAQAVTSWQATAITATRAVAQELRDGAGLPELPGRPQAQVSSAEFLGPLGEATDDWVATVRSEAAKSRGPIALRDVSETFFAGLQRADTAAEAIQYYRAYLYSVHTAWSLRNQLGGKSSN